MPNLSDGTNYRLLANACSTGCDEYGVTYYTGTSDTSPIFKYSTDNSQVSGQNKEFRLGANPFINIKPAEGIFEKDLDLLRLSDGSEIGAVRPLPVDRPIER